VVDPDEECRQQQPKVKIEKGSTRAYGYTALSSGDVCHPSATLLALHIIPVANEFQ
jgi:hypothetical protein